MSLIERVNAAVDAALVQRIVGCVILINKDGKEAYARAAGLADREANVSMRRDAIFRLASVTKPIVATTVLRLVDLVSSDSMTGLHATCRGSRLPIRMAARPTSASGTS